MSESPLQVVLLTTDFLPNIGGIAAHVAGLASGLSRSGHTVTVVVPQRVRGKWLAKERAERLDGYDVLRLDVPANRLLGRPFVPYVVKRLKKFIRSGVKVIHWHTYDYEILNKLPDVAKVFSNHTTYFIEFASDPDRIHRAKAIVRPADIVIAVSRQWAEATVATGFPAERIRLVSNGVDTIRFSPSVDGSAVRKRYGIGADECVILCPRRLVKKNGLIYWIQAIPLLLSRVRQKVRFMFVGDWQGKPEYSSREEVLAAIAALRLGDQIIFVGAVDNRDMHRYFAASDIVVIPSLVEATSIAGLEAMAAGRAILATNVGGLPEIITDGENGILVPPADAPALAEGAKKLVESPSRRVEMGKAGRVRAEREFDWVKIAARTTAVYREALDMRKSGLKPDA